jgi:hypothetical protein
LFGEIAEVPSKGFMRRVSHIHYENDVQRAEITLLRSDPKYRYKKNVRVWWALGWAHVIGIWRASIPWIEKLPLIFVVTKIFYARFQIQLRYEVFHPIFPRSRKDNEIPNW